MKNIFILLLALFVFTFSNAQIIDIPDANFKNALIEVGVDTNNDGEIQIVEAEDTTELIVMNENISSLIGIEYFVNLTYFNFERNIISEFNPEFSPNLKIIEGEDNLLTSIDFSQNPLLEKISLPNNDLETIIIGNQPELIQLFISKNSLTSVDVSDCPSLNTFTCTENLISSLNVTQNYNLEGFQFNENFIENINLTNNLNLEVLTFDDNPISSLNLNENTGIYYLSGTNTNLTSVTLIENINLLAVLLKDNNNLESVNISNGNNQVLNALNLLNCPNLNCIQVDDIEIANNAPNWYKDETAVYSEDCILSLEENNTLMFSVYPNPTQDVLYIESQQQIEKVKIYNLQGQLIKDGSSNKLDVSKFKTGLYFVEVTVDGKSTTKKFIKE